MREPRLALFAGAALVLALTLGVVGVIVAFENPSQGDLVALVGYLAIAGGVAVLVGYLASKKGLPGWGRSTRGRLILVAMLTSGLALANVGFIAALMFLSGHDLVILIAMLLFSLGTSVFVAVTLSSQTARSMEELIDAVRGLHAGRLDARVLVHTSDEIGELATAFNTMAQRLEASFARERELERSRRDLISSVSHDLRTPLASIRAMVESINDGVVTDPPTIKRYLETTEAEVDSLSQLISDIFELSQLEARVLELHLQEASLGDLISDTVNSMSAQAATRRVTLKGAGCEGMPPVVVDPSRIGRVLKNLVQNAIRHTPPDGSVSINVVDVGDEVQILVTDTGEGIPEHELENIFERSYRLDRSRNRSSGGAGLGLSIAKGIVEAHRGRIWADSALGQGTRFAFTLPKASPSVAD
ncbi:MAG: HAMP domain-containing histidine kinase [Chloroflexi bacterium]|nr:HAMP domain-containing histidine kinase [Chloroflexota bacterium]